MNKIFHDLIGGLESLKKTQNKENLEVKTLGTQTGTTETNFINKIYQMEDRVPGFENTIEEMNKLG